MKKLLLVIDYQKDFVDGALGFEGADRPGIRIADKIRTARREGWDVAFTLDTHGADYLSTSEGRHLPLPHCIKGTDGHTLHPLIADLVLPGDRIFEKPTFGSAELFDYLRENPYDEIELCGLVTDICVVSNAILAKTACPEAEVSVDGDACASFDPAKHEAALAVMESVQIKVNRHAL